MRTTAASTHVRCSLAPCAASSGSFGKVSLYRWKPGATETVNGELNPRSGLVAVKSLLPDVTGNASAMHDFHAEIDVLSRLSHSCLVACIGTGEMTLKTGESVLFMAMEAVTGGDLHTAVLGAMSAASTSSSSPLPFYKDADVVRWCHDISRGLHYLHTRSPMLIHRTLRTFAVWRFQLYADARVRFRRRPEA